MAATTNTTLGACWAVTAPSRRQLGGSILAAACGAAFAGAVMLPDQGETFPADASPDADLLAACADFDILEHAFQATDFNCTPNTPEYLANEVERSRIAMAQAPLINRMVELQAATHAGQAARARSLALWKPDLLQDGPGDFGECLTSAIVRDLLGLAV